MKTNVTNIEKLIPEEYLVTFVSFVSIRDIRGVLSQLRQEFLK